MSTGDLLLGGGLTLAGTVITQVVAFRIAVGERRATRRAVADDYTREALTTLQEAAADYQKALAAQAGSLDLGTPPAETEVNFQQARMHYLAVVYRVDPKITKKLSAWETVALQWSQGEAGAASEQAAYRTAMQACGDALRATLK